MLHKYLAINFSTNHTITTLFLDGQIAQVGIWGGSSGTDGIFQPGIQIGEVDINDGEFYVKFFSDLSQLYLVNVVTSKQKPGEE